MTVSHKTASIGAANKKKAKKISFFQSMKDEMKKVSWTTKEDLKVCTKIVVTSIFVLGLGIYTCDLIIRSVLNGFGSIARLIGG